jgi:hypothetical protein
MEQRECQSVQRLQNGERQDRVRYSLNTSPYSSGGDRQRSRSALAETIQQHGTNQKKYNYFGSHCFRWSTHLFQRRSIESPKRVVHCVTAEDQCSDQD